MKKIILFLLLTVAIATGASARDTYAHSATVLPAAAQATIKKNCKATVSVVKIDKTLGHIDDYEVVLTDGTEIEFDSRGNWKNVETSRNATVPAGFIPTAIQSYLKSTHSDARVIGIEKNRGGYDVELSNGIEMKFDNNGNFKRYDD